MLDKTHCARCERSPEEHETVDDHDLIPVCADSECDGPVAPHSDYCWMCKQDRDDCAREDAADADREERWLEERYGNRPAFVEDGGVE